MIELQSNEITAKDPKLISFLDGSFNHPSIGKYSNFPFNKG